MNPNDLADEIYVALMEPNTSFIKTLNLKEKQFIRFGGGSKLSYVITWCKNSLKFESELIPTTCLDNLEESFKNDEY